MIVIKLKIKGNYFDIPLHPFQKGNNQNYFLINLITDIYKNLNK